MEVTPFYQFSFLPLFCDETKRQKEIFFVVGHFSTASVEFSGHIFLMILFMCAAWWSLFVLCGNQIYYPFFLIILTLPQNVQVTYSAFLS